MDFLLIMIAQKKQTIMAIKRGKYRQQNITLFNIHGQNHQWIHFTYLTIFPKKSSTQYQQNFLIKEITNYVFYRSCPSPPTIPNVNIFFSFAYLENIMNSFQLRPAWW